MQNKYISAAALAAALALAYTPAFALSLSAAPAYPAKTGTTEHEHLPPVSAAASNLTAYDTHSDIAPPLPVPPASPDATLLHYPRIASGDLSRSEAAAAQQALEMAETRLLDRSVVASRAGQPDVSPVIEHISQALNAIGNHDLSTAQGQTSLAMSNVVNSTTL